MSFLPPETEKEFMHYKYVEGLPQLRIVFICLILLYGGFGYLDSLLIEDYLQVFLLIRFAVVIPMFLLTIFLMSRPIFTRIGQELILFNLIIGGAGVSFMLIIYPDNMSYYGGALMVVFAGYFLIMLNTGFAIAGGLSNLLLYLGGVLLYYRYFPPESLYALLFIIGSNVIGALGNYQLEKINRIKYVQGIEIEKNNRQLEEVVGRQHEALLQIQKAIESTSEAVCIFNLEGKPFYANKAFQTLTGYSVSDFAGDFGPEVLFEDRAYLARVISAVKQFGTWKDELELIVGGKNRVMTIFHTDAVYDDVGRITAYIALFKDITGRKTAEKALAASEEKYRLLTEFGSDVIWVYNLKHNKFTYISPSVFMLRGFSPEEAMNQTLEESMTPDSYERVTKILGESLSEFASRYGDKDYYTDEFQQTCKNGDVVWTEASVKYRYNSDKEIELVGSSRNIEQRKQSEKEILYLSYHDHLTGLYNRRFYEEELKRLDTSRNLPLSLIMFDINGLKLANDAFGHSLGDQLLVKAAETIKQVCRSDEITARTGGDEFVILLPRTDYRQAGDVAQRVKQATLNKFVESIELSVSLGWATKTEEDENIENIYKQAEDIMYQRKIHESPSVRGNTIKTIVQTLFEKLPGEKEHSDRVSQISQMIGRELEMSNDDVLELKTAGLLHDIGKITISETALSKPASLNESEWSEIKRHPETGYRILSSVAEMGRMAEYTLAHHENWNGSGYPKGLKEKEIPLQARIIRIADSYDAMVSERHYKMSLTPEQARQEIINNAGIQFDPELVKLFAGKVFGLIASL